MTNKYARWLGRAWWVSLMVMGAWGCTDPSTLHVPPGPDAGADASGEDAEDDLDADDDGIPDDVEGQGDSDGDGTPDYLDTDSDDDGIPDLAEGALDTDNDGVPNYLDTDSDGDCRGDAIEFALADADADGRPSYLDRDADADGVGDGEEDANCDGVVDPSETDPQVADTDGDGATDLVEQVAGTSPVDPQDNPRAHGDFIFLVPYQEAPEPAADNLAFETSVKKVDLYVLMDRSASMQPELEAVKTGLVTAIDALRCQGLPQGICIEDLWAGAGTVGSANFGGGGTEYHHDVDLSPNPNLDQMLTAQISGLETLTFGVFAAVTGGGVAEANAAEGFPLTDAEIAAKWCSGSTMVDNSTGQPYATQPMKGPVPANESCADSPAAAAGGVAFGYPCFRGDALSIIALATDERPLGGNGTYQCPRWDTVVLPEVLARNVKVVGITGANPSSGLMTDLRRIATETGAVDGAGAPIVVEGADEGAADAIADAVYSLAAGIPLDMGAVASDVDDGDAVDAVAAFVDRLVLHNQTAPACTGGLSEADGDGDGVVETALDVPVRTPVCWDVEAKENTTVPATDEPQLFRAQIRVMGEGVTELDMREVYFLVPPDLEVTIN